MLSCPTGSCKERSAGPSKRNTSGKSGPSLERESLHWQLRDIESVPGRGGGHRESSWGE